MTYSVILADPPWHFQNYAADAPGMMHDRSRGANRYYPTMLNADIAALPVSELASDNAILFMWSCWPLLPEAIEIIHAWGFEYKTLAWVWIKLDRIGMGFFHGMGYYTRSNSEPCLLATRGNLPKPKARDVQALICSPIREHSRKPDEQYAKIERLYPDGPYLEMFARRKHSERWDVWGNEVESDVQIEIQK